MEMNLVDGLGYDSVKEQYFTVTYAWKNIVPNQKKSKTTIGKSGITRYDVKTAMSEAVPTRGRQFHQEALWGHECDRKYLPKDISEKDANKIVQTMDSLFKESMLDWTCRHKKQSKEIGTEFYEGPVNEWLDRIKEEWADAFSGAIMRVLGFDYNFDISMVQAMGNQGTVTEQIGEVLLENNKVRSIIPCGYGKSFIMWIGIHKWKPFQDKKFIIYYCHSIPATKQLAVKHSQYSNGGDGFKRVVVCSEKKYVNGQVKYGIENYSASESKLSEVLEESFKSPERVIFYVNNRSAGEFQEKFKSISKKLRLTINPGAVVDEEQEFTGHKDIDKVDAIVRSISDYQVSFTATERRRGTDKNQDRIYNDDVDYFGVVATEITVSQTISEGRSCPINFKTVEVSDNHTLMREIENNGVIETIFNDDTTLSVRGRMLRSVICLVKSIKEDNRTHPMVVTSLIVNTYSFIRLITKLQELDIIPNDYVIVRGLRNDGINSAVEFNNHKKAIFVGTPWMVTGTDAPNTDGLIADYDMGSEITGSQWIGRGQRPVDNKELMVYIPTNPDSTEISTLLRVANKYIQDENVHIEAEETNVEEDNVDVLGSVQRRNITTQIDRDINANSSLKLYWDKIYKDLTTNIIGRTGEYLKIDWLPFEELREYVRGLGIRTFIQYGEYCTSGNKPNFIPSIPYRVYPNDWLSWGDFLGTKPGWIGEYKPFVEARDYVWSLGIKSQDEWQEYSKSGKRPFDIPANPKSVYGNEFISLFDWLGTKKGWVGYITYNELVEHIKPLNIKSCGEWNNYWKTNTKPNNIPGYPQNTYKEWVSWSRFLGTKEKVPYISYKESHNLILKLKLKSIKEWNVWSKTNRPDNVPSNPNLTYKNNGWESWGVFLGTGVVADKNKVFLPYKKAKNIIHLVGLKNVIEWRKYSSSSKKPSNIPAGPKDYYDKTNEWVSWSDWLGNCGVDKKNKFSEEFLINIKNLLKEGVSQVEIHKKYEIGRSKLSELNKQLK